MKSLTITPLVAAAGMTLILGLMSCDVWLVIHSAQQSAIIDGFVGKQDADIPKEGQAVPVLSGQKMSTGKTWSILPAASPPMALLIFRESCHFCEENWKNWDTLFSKNDLAVSVVFLTEDKTISDSYKQKHPLLLKNPVLLGVNPTLLASIKPGFTPQTIFISNGSIRHDWAGLLGSSDIEEIHKVLPKPED